MSKKFIVREVHYIVVDDDETPESVKEKLYKSDLLLLDEGTFDRWDVEEEA